MGYPDTATQKSLRITVFGCGTLGKALVNGVLAKNPPGICLERIVLTARRASHAEELQATFPELTVTLNNLDSCIWDDHGSRAPQGLHLLILGPKPHDIKALCVELSMALNREQHQPLAVVTLCPGITVSQLQNWLSCEVPIVRAMPNTPVMVLQGAAGLFPSPQIGQFELDMVRATFGAISPAVVVLSEESHLNVVASISGSAPAYFFHLMQCMITAATDLGLSESLATTLVTQSCIGSGHFARAAPNVPLVQLKDDVCVPGGSTRKAMDVLDANNWHLNVQDAIRASWKANIAMRGKGGDE